ncbi:MAG: type II secretion system protein [Dehalococcoidia bacterium]|nr:type II secretion system protein [Dehalococcoidia bacterium]MCK5654072.1 type II secretion system protein [Dehalococcoidia bacterium]
MNKKGFLLIETVIAIAVFAIVAIGFMQGIQVGILGTYRDSQINTALHLAQSQMEYIKSLPYDDEPPFEYGTVPEEHPGYDIGLTVDCVYTPGDPPECVTGLQLITVNVSYQDKSVVLQGYKTNR